MSAISRGYAKILSAGSSVAECCVTSLLLDPPVARHNVHLASGLFARTSVHIHNSAIMRHGAGLLPFTRLPCQGCSHAPRPILGTEYRQLACRLVDSATTSILDPNLNEPRYTRSSPTDFRGAVLLTMLKESNLSIVGGQMGFSSLAGTTGVPR